MTYLFALAAAAASIAAPAPAALGDARLPAAATAAPSRYTATYDARHDTYCIKDRDAQPRTGTRIVPIECHSKADWARLGLTIDHRA